MSDAGADGAREKPDGLGHDGTIPPDTEGVAAGITDEDSNFNPEEDPEKLDGIDPSPS